MLVILYGVSCVGKTTVISELIKNHNWKPINCYLTRDIRSDDIARIKISKKEFIAFEKDKFFLAVNKHFDTWYGTPLNEIEHAVSSQEEIFVLDFMIGNRHQLASYDHKKVIIIPESEEQLATHVKKTNRLEREDEILNDYRKNYNTDQLVKYLSERFAVVTNYELNLRKTIESIKSHI